MPSRQITHVSRDDDGVTTAVKGPWGKTSADSAIVEIERGVNTYFTDVRGVRAEVKIGKTGSGKKYLTTSPDGSKPNNLDFLEEI